MTEGHDFATLIRRVREGDGQAASELIRLYEAPVRREARLRLSPSLRPLFDSLDLCQSVLGSFFVRVAAGQYDVDSPARLMRLLIAMTRNKVREKARRRREMPLDVSEPVSRGADPGDRIHDQDFLDEFQRRLSEDERQLWGRRRRGDSWQAIASELGVNPVALRQQYSRAVRRAAEELGLDDVL